MPKRFRPSDDLGQIGRIEAVLPRLLILTSTYPRWEHDTEPGFIHELARRLVHRFDVHVLCPHAPGAASSEEMEGVTVHRYRYAPGAIETLVQGGGILANLKHHPWKWALLPGFMTGSLLATAKLIRTLKPQCIHAHWIIPQGLVTAALPSLGLQMPPVLLTSHGGDLFALKKWPLDRFKQWAIRHAAAVTVVSSAMLVPAKALGAPEHGTHVIPMGADFIGRFSPPIPGMRQPNQLLFIGRLVEKKGVDVLLQAMPAIIAKHPEVRLRVVGYGPEQASLHQLATTLAIQGHVEFTGAMPQSQLKPLLQQASVFVAPFRAAGSGDQEGFPVALTEAIASGCPFVVGRLPAIAEAVGQEAEELLTEPGDAGELAFRVSETLARVNETEKQVLALRSRLISRLDWEHVAERYAVLLQEVAGNDEIAAGRSRRR